MTLCASVSPKEKEACACWHRESLCYFLGGEDAGMLRLDMRDHAADEEGDDSCGTNGHIFGGAEEPVEGSASERRIEAVLR